MNQDKNTLCSNMISDIRERNNLSPFIDEEWGWERDRAILATRWLVEDVLNWKDSYFARNICKCRFVTHGLQEMLYQVYDGDIYDCIDDAYPGKFQWWQFITAYDIKWDFTTSVAAIRWLLKEKLSLSISQIKKVYSNKFLIDHGFKEITLKHSIFDILDVIYPNTFKYWELESSYSKNFWNEERAVEAIKWLVDDILDISHTEARFLKKKHFQSFRIGGAYKYFNMNATEIVDYVFFDKKPTIEKQYLIDVLKKDEIRELYRQVISGERSRFPKNFFNPEGKDVYGVLTRMLVEDVLNWDYEVSLNKLSAHHFKENYLGGMLREIYKNNVTQALEDAYNTEL